MDATNGTKKAAGSKKPNGSRTQMSFAEKKRVFAL
jgi:hypothetical protein